MIRNSLIVFVAVVLGFLLADFFKLPKWTYPFALLPACYLFVRLYEGKRPGFVPLLLFAAGVSGVFLLYKWATGG